MATAATACAAWRRTQPRAAEGERARSANAAMRFHVDTLDLYSRAAAGRFHQAGREELGVKEDVIRRDLGRVLLKLEELQDEQIRKALEPKQAEAAMSDGERAEALDAAARSEAARPHPRRLRAMRHGGRGDQQAGRLSRPPCRGIWKRRWR